MKGDITILLAIAFIMIAAGCYILFTRAAGIKS